LEHDEDKDFLLHGLAHGFDIIDPEKEGEVISVERDNYSSATSKEYRDKVEARLLAELEEGNYRIVKNKPKIISALGAIPKPDGDVRLIHDCSQPAGSSLNDYSTIDSVKYQSVNDALNMIGPGWYQCKIDLRWAYRVCGINPEHYTFTGLKWHFIGDKSHTYLVDTRLSFGARKSPHIYHRLTQAVKRMMARRGFKNIVVFLDDFYCAASTIDECRIMQCTLISLLRELGFHINWKKVVDPTQHLVFLGINIDTKSGTLWLDPDKAVKLTELTGTVLKQTRCTRKQLESIAGKLSWASTVNPWGRLHLRSLYDAISATKNRTHKVKLLHLLPDIEWWHSCLKLGNNKRLIWDTRPLLHVFTDSSSLAGGAFCHGDWLYRVWHIDRPNTAHWHINLKELQMIGEAVNHWAKIFYNHRVCIHTDNISSAFMVNKGCSRNLRATAILRTIGFMAFKYNFALEAYYIPGRHNDVADAISRLHLPGQIQRYFALLWGNNLLTNGFWMQCHMSLNAMYFLSPQVKKWKHLIYSWIKKQQGGERMPLRNLQGLSTRPN
jgi:hypothetical protein